MEKRQCINCGAPLKYIGFGQYKCEYCNSKYEAEGNNDHIHFIEVCAPPVKVISAQAVVDNYLIRADPNVASHYVIDTLATSLADTLKEYMTIDEMIDPIADRKIYRGKIRIVPSDYRYG